ncbi:TadE/TadG family type IV pilus assembly protein [Paenibacillus segetis]|uniref:TadE-like protein n=1 Tax=Paenibacillus segetis TaxID=1325360 RepID=A0ABQ1Y612_9BACL|nr:pilus assembly protein [Paenibacillus segetis]GGH13224.1 hypothetical protein GCM10008013_06150 [Paenibacillus segetis]
MNLLRNRDGSFTLEASLVFPTIFTTLLILLFFCLYLYQNTLLGHIATMAAERSAYTWDNSHRNPRTGAFEITEHDSLYWRLKDDGMLQAIFGWSGQTSPSVLQLPSEANSDRALPLQKLSRVGSEIPQGIDGEMTYGNKLLFRKITVSMNRLIPFAPLERVIGDVTQFGQSTSYVVEPVEWIRTVDLARYYGAKFKGSGNDHVDKNEAGKALDMFGK